MLFPGLVVVPGGIEPLAQVLETSGAAEHN